MSVERRPSSVFVGSGALVSGYAAHKLDQLLEPVWSRIDVAPEWRADLEEARWALRQAALDFRARVDEVARRRVDAEAAEASEGPAGAGRSRCAEQMTAAEVAQVLEVSDRRVRQLAPSLGGRKGRGGQWTFSRAEVLAYVEGRSA